MKRIIAAAIAAVAPACSASPRAAATTTAAAVRRAAPGSRSRAAPIKSSIGAGEGKLNLIVWAGYAEDGSTDPKVDWVTPFEKSTGCQVNAKTASTSDEMVTLMRTGRYDGVSASGNASVRLIAGGDVRPDRHEDPHELRRTSTRCSRTSPTTRSTARCTARRTATARTS